MRLRLSWVVFALLVPNVAFADKHWADNYVGFAWNDGGSSVYGVHDSLLVEVPKWPNLGWVPADFSVLFGEQETQVTYMTGARYTRALSKDLKGHPMMHAQKYHFEALLGTVYTNDGASTSTDKTDKDFAYGFGAGYEVVGKKIKSKSLGVRVMYDAIKRNGLRDGWFNRVSTGITYRWEKD
jgi:hypothetical protein